jgi:hypothetical protein
MPFRLPDADDARAVLAAFGGDNEENAKSIHPDRTGSLFLVLAVPFDPGLRIGILKGRDAVRQGQPMLAAVDGILPVVPLVFHTADCTAKPQSRQSAPRFNEVFSLERDTALAADLQKLFADRWCLAMLSGMLL